ncbi:MAG TPA: hypothetical protein VEN81_02485, partial [Planctomycetota bacterium]|nr:hypothetical protein [Planctomycetota bacterium]
MPGPHSPGPMGVGNYLLGHWKLVGAVLWILSGCLYLTLPPSPDQFQHGYLGWRFSQGDAPYHDFIDMNWPGVMGLQALASVSFGNHLWSWRALDFILFFGSSIFLADLVRRAMGALAGRIHILL